jgi:hypothetical protein
MIVSKGRILTGLGLFLALVTTGCDSKTSVNGNVTHKGKPVVWGTVILVDSTGEFHQGDIDINGKYSIDNVPTGTAKIGVTSPNPSDTQRKGAGRGASKGGIGLDDPREKFLKSQGSEKNADRPLPPAGSWFALPTTAADPQTSGITGKVEKGKPLDIEVK